MRKGRVTLIDPRMGFFVSRFKKKKEKEKARPIKVTCVGKLEK